MSTDPDIETKSKKVELENIQLKNDLNMSTGKDIDTKLKKIALENLPESERREAMQKRFVAKTAALLEQQSRKEEWQYDPVDLESVRVMDKKIAVSKELSNFFSKASNASPASPGSSPITPNVLKNTNTKGR